MLNPASSTEILHHFQSHQPLIVHGHNDREKPTSHFMQPVDSSSEGARQLLRRSLKAAGRPEQRKQWGGWYKLSVLLYLQLPVNISNYGEELFQHLQFKKSQRIYHVGKLFSVLFVVPSGFLKTVQIDKCGNERVPSLPMKGGLVGADGICHKHHVPDAMALSECEVILLSFAEMTGHGQRHSDMTLPICCFHTLVGAENFCVIRSCRDTLRKQAHGMLETAALRLQR